LKKNKSVKSVLAICFLFFIVGTTVFLTGCDTNKKTKETVKKKNEPLHFVGAVACQTCHNKEYNDWKKSDHFLTMQPDKESSESFQNSIEEIEIHKLGITIDEEFKDYKIYIYHLNTDTRMGNAFIRNSNNEEEMSKPKVKINGEDALDHTKYTESLYLSKWIDVKAKAKKVGEKFKHLDIDYEE